MTLTAPLFGLHEVWDHLVERHPWLRWCRKWGISAGSFVLGLFTLFVFRRGIEYFPWFVGYLVLLWLAGVVFAEGRELLATRAPRPMGLIVDYTVQILFHGLLLFLIPIYYASTTLWSANVGFLLLLVAAAVLTTIDPLYRAVIGWARWIEIALFGFGLFASLNVAFPLLRLRGHWALLLSGLGSLLALAPVFRRRLEISWQNALLIAGISGVVAGLVLWPLRGWIPPVPLQLTRATFARSVMKLEPVTPVSTLSADELARWGGVSAFTAVAAPAGLREPIYHLWSKNGMILGKIGLSPIRGGRREGFRTHSRKTDLGTSPAGTWTVDIMTGHDQLIGRIRLVVTP